MPILWLSFFLWNMSIKLKSSIYDGDYSGDNCKNCIINLISQKFLLIPRPDYLLPSTIKRHNVSSQLHLHCIITPHPTTPSHCPTMPQLTILSPLSDSTIIHGQLSLTSIVPTTHKGHYHLHSYIKSLGMYPITLRHSIICILTYILLT